MKIAGVKTAIPSRKMNNEAVKAMVAEYSGDILKDKLRAAINRVDFYLTFSGSERRHWLADGETPFDFLEQAVNGALAQAGTKRSEVELIVYTGVDRGFIEPAAAYLVASALGMPQAHCFDIVDACMSWTRAAFLVNSLFASGQYKNALIVNCEFNMRPNGRINPACFRLKSVDNVDWSFPAFTLGEAATATLLVADKSRPWEFHFSSAGDHSDLCTIPVDGYELYCRPTERTGLNGANVFTSFGSDMFRAGKPYLLDIFGKLDAPRDEIKAIFPHAASKQLWWEMGTEIGVSDKIWFVYPDYGNLVSASVPSGIAMAMERGAIREGDRIAGWIGSAGLSFASFSCEL
jgi:3-oxoacyl-[acyl-carrier-protein] synthase III